jgi:hypothetical protein
MGHVAVVETIENVCCRSLVVSRGLFPIEHRPFVARCPAHVRWNHGVQLKLKAGGLEIVIRLLRKRATYGTQSVKLLV